ncbi:hypothetical protein Tco_0654626 [Tanacetum coccineum]|uniref:Uncharacterized protein n=1 Tax=Tanacetum coccineum TaxID=301880 RepID=A0ABQ4X409_9ASTR
MTIRFILLGLFVAWELCGSNGVRGLGAMGLMEEGSVEVGGGVGGVGKGSVVVGTCFSICCVGQIGTMELCKAVDDSGVTLVWALVVINLGVCRGVWTGAVLVFVFRGVEDGIVVCTGLVAAGGRAGYGLLLCCLGRVDGDARGSGVEEEGVDRVEGGCGGVGTGGAVGGFTHGDWVGVEVPLGVLFSMETFVPRRLVFGCAWSDITNLPTSSYDDDDDKESSIPLRDIIMSELPPCVAITPDTPKPDSLIIEDKHLDIIPENRI